MEKITRFAAKVFEGAPKEPVDTVSEREPLFVPGVCFFSIWKGAVQPC